MRLWRNGVGVAVCFCVALALVFHRAAHNSNLERKLREKIRVPPISEQKKVVTGRHIFKLRRCLRNGLFQNFSKALGGLQWPLELRYSENRNLTFLHIYKNAGSAINQLLNKEKGKFVQYSRWSPKKDWQRALQAKVVAFVRDPLDRFLSAYYEIMLRKFVEPKNWTYIFKYDCLTLVSKDDNFSRMETFRTFIKCLGPQSWHDYEEHVLPQAAFLLRRTWTPRAGPLRVGALTPFLIDNLNDTDHVLKTLLGHAVKLPVVHHLHEKDERFRFEHGVADLPEDVLSYLCTAFGRTDYCCLDIPIRPECASYVQCGV